MRIGVVLAAVGAVLGGGLALLARVLDRSGRHVGFGWWADSPLGAPRRYVDYLPRDVLPRYPGPPWWPVFAALGAGLVFGALVGLALHLLGFGLARNR